MAVVRTTLLVAVAGIAALIAGTALPPPVSAGQLLENGGFEAGTSPWSLDGAASIGGAPAIGSAAIHASGDASVTQTIAVSGGASLEASGQFALVDGAAFAASITLTFFDSGFVVLDSTGANGLFSAASFGSVSVTTVAPVSAAWVRFSAGVSGTGGDFTAAIDGLSLFESVGPPTPTPTATPTPSPAPVTPTATATPTSAAATSTPTTTPTQGPGGGSGGGATATNTPKPPTPTRTPTPSSGGSQQPKPTATKTPAPPSTATPTPSGPPPPAFGGLLTNGNFEQLTGSQPAAWAKYGGEIFSSTFGRSGRAGGLLSGTTSTKWLFQVVSVDGGNWYRASGWGRLESGSGEVWMRVSWYSSYDGTGSLIDQADSNASSGGGWSFFDTGAVQAPASANSARVRLMLRPAGSASAAFDDVSFVASAAATPTPQATATPTKTPMATKTPTATRTPRATRTPSPRRSGSGGSSSGGGAVAPAPFAGLVQAGSGPLVLSEVYPNPDAPGDDNANEWIEIWNGGTETVDLAGWAIGDAKSMDSLPAASIPPGTYAIVAAHEASFATDLLVVRVPDGRIGSGLNNSGDSIVLVAPDGTAADAVSFGDDTTYGTNDLPGAGESLGRAGDGAWRLTLTPSPGRANEFEAGATETAPAVGSRTPAGRATRTAATAPSSLFGNDEGAAGEASIEVNERDKGMSPWVWAALGGGATAGAYGLYASARRHGPALLERVRRGR